MAICVYLGIRDLRWFTDTKGVTYNSAGICSEASCTQTAGIQLLPTNPKQMELRQQIGGDFCLSIRSILATWRGSHSCQLWPLFLSPSVHPHSDHLVDADEGIKRGQKPAGQCLSAGMAAQKHVRQHFPHRGTPSAWGKAWVILQVHLPVQPMQDNSLPQPPPAPCLLQAASRHLMNDNGAADVWELVTLLNAVCVSAHSDSPPFVSNPC